MQMGMVAKLWRYPVKSMLGETCERLEIDARGAQGDRAYAVRDPDGSLGSGKTTRRFPDGQRIPAGDPGINAALSRALCVPVTLVREERVSHFDSAPLHILTTASLRWLQADERRFRPNIVVELPGDAPAEQGWIGKTLAIGDSVVVRIVEPTERCVMTTFAQAELPADPRVLKRIGRDANLRFGVYAEVLSPGTIACGDLVYQEFQ